MTNNFLEKKVGPKKRKVKVLDVTINDVKDSKKIEFLVVDEQIDKTFIMSDAWVIDQKTQELKIRGLWDFDTDTVPPNSSLASLMRYYEMNSLKDFIDTEVWVYPDSKNFLVLVACDNLIE